MDYLLCQLEKKKSWKSFFKTQCRRNSVNPSLVNSFTVLKFRKFFEERPRNIEPSDKSRKKSLVWLQNELKAYQWFLIVMSGCRELPIENFTTDEWEQLSNIFNKQPSILQYEATRLIRERKNTKRKWESQESDLLQGIINQDHDNNKWNEIARKLFQLSHGKYFRSGKQCRQQWLNHLDPQKKHGDWNPSEDLAIVEFILHKGKKWAEMVRELNNARTEHMIKNRFKTIMIKLRKTHTQVTKESELLQLKIAELSQEKGLKPAFQPEPEQVDRNKPKERPDFAGLPIMDSEEEDQEDFDCENPQMNERIGTGFKQLEFQQVVTPCPIIYQTFTPSFLNTPHAMQSFLSSNFAFTKNDNLFLKNN